MAWVVADLCRGPRATFLTLSEEVTGLAVKNLAWPASLPASVLHLTGAPLELLGVRVEFSTTSVVGNRVFSIEFQDLASDLVSLAVPATAVAASTSGAVEFHPTYRMANSVEPAGTTIRTNLPRGAFIYPGRQITILDQSVIDLSDTLIVHVRARVRERPSR